MSGVKWKCNSSRILSLFLQTKLTLQIWQFPWKFYWPSQDLIYPYYNLIYTFMFLLYLYALQIWGHMQNLWAKMILILLTTCTLLLDFVHLTSITCVIWTLLFSLLFLSTLNYLFSHFRLLLKTPSKIHQILFDSPLFPK